ncbi:uncharacterized protein G2W53_036421 [Senna tora]|uniref:Uncharacterized protein n=1 Tax=Senna tora TaxID=362788 RepID=A0A834SSK3_9FABA|nr:uncharacterized protein G2W53_036421 [Senna tora]
MEIVEVPANGERNNESEKERRESRKGSFSAFSLSVYL